MKQFIHILLAISFLTLSNIASAAPIHGKIDFAGGYTTDTGDKNTANIFTFLRDVRVIAASGSFSSLTHGNSTLDYNELDLSNVPMTLWSKNQISFDLERIVSDDLFNGFRFIKGTGTFHIGQSNQFGTWSFSTQGGGTDGIFSFSAYQEAPEPAILGLLGLGLIGIGARHKFRKV